MWHSFFRWGRVIGLPSDRAIFGYAVALAAVAFVVRIAFPIDRWISLGGLINAELAHLPQYASLFVLGLLAARVRWLEMMPTRRAMRWLALAVRTRRCRRAAADCR